MTYPSKRVREAVNAERTSREYASHFYESEASMAGHFKLDTELLDKLLQPKGSIFDAMMARGRHVLHFARKGYVVGGNDINPYMVQFVKSDLKKEKLRALLYNIDVTDLSKIDSNSFDYVICMYSSLGCIPGNQNRQRALKEFARIVKPNGRVVVHAHSRLGAIEKFRDVIWAIREYLNFRDHDLERGDCYYIHSDKLGYTYNHAFEVKELRELFKSANLKIVKEYCLSLRQNGFCPRAFKFLSGGFIFVGMKEQPISL